MIIVAYFLQSFVEFKNFRSQFQCFQLYKFNQSWRQEVFMAELYRTDNHPEGISELPQYVILCGVIYRTVTQSDGKSKIPQYVIRGGKIYRTNKHPNGYNALQN